MASEPIKVLLVEDNPGDARLLRLLLDEAGATEFELTHVTTLAAALDQLTKGNFNLMLLDLSLPDATGFDTVTRAHAAAQSLPIVVLTGLNDETVAVEAVRKGAQDYLVKGQITGSLLARALRYAVERKRNEVELTKLNELKNQFLGMAAHDLRNPLAVILACSDMLLDRAAVTLSEEKRQQLLSRIKTNAEFMLRLVNNLLDVAKIEAGRLNLDIKETDLRNVIQSSIELNVLGAARKGVELSFEPEADLPAVPADFDKLEQVLNNLISNAVKFSPRGGTVTIHAGRNGTGVLVSVQDQGPGIPAAELGKLFQPFARLSTSTATEEKSTGLGLAICRKVVEGHGGRIWAESEPGKGATFYFTIPVARNAPSPS